MKAMKITEKSFQTFREEADRDYSYQRSLVLGRYCVIYGHGSWFLMFEDNFKATYRFTNGESPSGFREIENNLT